VTITARLRDRGWYVKKWSLPKKLLVIASATVAGNRQMADYIGIVLGMRGGQDAQLSLESVLETLNLVRLEPQNVV
jgi:hypothetical protein